ncbi:MAG: hypothetical protein GC152_16000 [Alphaproteobacteria bacterium]|nr:hypothetical protein [Alphaproteobacteria bacterium]
MRSFNTRPEAPRALIAPLCAAIVAGNVAGADVAAAADPPPRVRSAVFLETVAAKGVECGLLRHWQAATLRAANLNDMARWKPEDRTAMNEATRERLSDIACDDAGINAWIEGAGPGFESEMLPPYLIAYLTLVGYEDPPKVFTQTTTRILYGPAIEAIRQKLEALETSGAMPEGGKPWPAYIETTQRRFRDVISALWNEDASLEERAEAAGIVGQTAHVVELWLLDEGV